MKNESINNYMCNETLKSLGISKSEFYNLNVDYQMLLVYYFWKNKFESKKDSKSKEKIKVLSLFKK